MYKIQTLNNISVAGLDRLPRDKYEIASELSHPDAILVRSAKMHDLPLPESVKAFFEFMTQFGKPLNRRLTRRTAKPWLCR